ncbi:septum site-determining protein MinC [Clostridium algidicarnis]|uniref:Probable septum site-determining protein MinC n=2 Tax=Clostridium algidicarnis TaxID=37659 RepID=A0A2S6FX23_9CLOT|nr:septum site-determining protein MinC [Clostridium algidicarnis]MBB6630614.1 septum site-determining protein MinC [Clostridium algidicarnis]MBB6697445.1 septum site-determining protein MinC [Clostridium algidicarnis]MBU3194837.1 septum site-determining protein MinC [Clostridium algidicarnis]MBU3202715.1 septum site-determining protein MinC [Clostridium algidicarnis]MBU3206817.1 septum site-determining protein MinC [Clostridium algidicarnis]
MNRDNIVIKGNKEGLNAIINMDNFKDFDDMLESLIEKLSKGKKFYKGCTLKITTDIRLINENQAKKLKEILFEEVLIKDCIFEDKEEKASKVFSGIYEGRTKFIRKTVRSGQIIRYSGNIVIIGDVNPGSEIHAEGNVIVMGNLRGQVRAGITGNERAIIVAFNLQPEILQIASIITRAPEDSLKPEYPEVAKIKEGSIIVEPYVVNKYI